MSFETLHTPASVRRPVLVRAPRNRPTVFIVYSVSVLYVNSVPGTGLQTDGTLASKDMSLKRRLKSTEDLIPNGTNCLAIGIAVVVDVSVVEADSVSRAMNPHRLSSCPPPCDLPLRNAELPTVQINPLSRRTKLR